MSFWKAFMEKKKKKFGIIHQNTQKAKNLT